MKNLILAMALMAGIFISGCSKDDDEPIISAELVIGNNGNIINNQEHVFVVTLTNEDGSVESVDLFIDGELTKTLFSPPYSFNLTLSDLTPGEHIANAVINTSNEKITAESLFEFQVMLGQEFQGGIIIHLSEDGLNGLIASKQNIDGGILGMYKYGAYNGNYEAYSENDGYSNTLKFEGKFDSNYAAPACLQYSWGGFDDWYLPAKNEIALFEGFLHELNIPERSSDIYWSSTESEEDPEFAFIFTTGGSHPLQDKQSLGFVKPVRKF